MVHPYANAEHDRADALVIVYELRPTGTLPVIDCAKTVKRVVFSKPWLVRYGVFQRATKRVLPVSFVLGLGFATAQLFLTGRVNYWNASASTVLLFFPVFSSYMMLRVDMLALLSKSYEFWYFMVVSLASSVLVAVNFGDLRAIVSILCASMYQYTLMIDASARNARASIIASASGAVVLTMFVFLQAFDLVKDYGNVRLVDFSSWQLRATDVAVNGLSMVVVVLLRNAYRKHHAIANVDQENATVRCISYRTRVRLVPLEVPSSDRVLNTTSPPPSRTQLSTTSISQLRIVSSTNQFHANDFVLKWLTLPATATAVWVQQWWTTIGVLGLVLSTVSIVVRDDRPVVPLIAVLCSGSYIARCVAFHNRSLLHYVRFSFDFVFLMAQSYIAHIVLCHLLEWQVSKCLPVLSSALWMHWVVTLDLLTPVVRHRLGLESSLQRLALAVLVLEMAGHIFLVLEILFHRHWIISDRLLFQISLTTTMTTKIYAVPFLLTRMATTFCWCLRLAWRVCLRSGNTELLMVHGAVEYDDEEAARRRIRRADSKKNRTSTHAPTKPTRPAAMHASIVPHSPS